MSDKHPLCCRREDLEQLSQEKRGHHNVLVKNVEVFASPSRQEFNRRKRDWRPDAMTPAYPDVCYSVEETTAGLHDMVRIATHPRLAHDYHAWLQMQDWILQ